MPLEHVSMWREGIGWERVTADKADILFSYTVRAYSRMFICDLCHKHVVFVKGNINVSHFKHNKGDPDKECADLTQKISRSKDNILFDLVTLPMRIMVSNTSFYLELGFLPIPVNQIKQAERAKAQVRISSAEGIAVIKSINSSNFSSEMTVYHPLDNRFSEKYKIEIIPVDINVRLPLYQREIRGLYPNGTLFDYQTGKRIPFDGDVEVGKKYYLLSSKKHYVRTDTGIQLNGLMDQGQYRLNTVIANRITKETTEFFFQYHARLTSEPTKLILVWPILHEGDHYIESAAPDIFFLLKGDSSAETYPNYGSRCLKAFVLHGKSIHQLIRLKNLGRVQMVWAARLSVLRYLYIRNNEAIGQATAIPHASITTEDGVAQECGIHYNLPKGKKLYVSASFDGRAIRKRNGTITNVYKITANTTAIIEKLSYNEEILVYQGKDQVFAVAFRRAAQIKPRNETTIINSLNACSGPFIYASHRLGCIALELNDMPKVAEYLKVALRNRHIRKDALSIITKVGGERKNG